MPVYNGEETIRHALDSLLAQTFSNFELIISDNASIDGTAKICREYASRDERIRYVRQDVNIGASENYNAVFRLARGDYFKWASSNDICEPTFIQRCVEVLDALSETVLVCPRTRLLGELPAETKEVDDPCLVVDGENPCDRYQHCITRMRLNNVMNGVFRSAVLRRTALFRNYFASDVNLIGEVALHGKFNEVPEYLFNRRMDSRSAIVLRKPEEVVTFYVPTRRKPMFFQNWKIVFSRFGAVRRAPVGLLHRFCLIAFCLKCVLWSKGVLLEDLVFACGFRRLAIGSRE